MGKGFVGDDMSKFMVAVERGSMPVKLKSGQSVDMPLTLPLIKYLAKNSMPGWVFTATPQEMFDKLADAGFFDDGQLEDYQKIVNSQNTLDFQIEGAGRPLTRLDENIKSFDFGQAKKDIAFDDMVQGSSGLNDERSSIGAENALRAALEQPGQTSEQSLTAGKALLQKLAGDNKSYRGETQKLLRMIDNLGNKGFINSRVQSHTDKEIEELRRQLADRAR
jgi:hypothetical protein